MSPLRSTYGGPPVALDRSSVGVVGSGGLALETRFAGTSPGPASSVVGWRLGRAASVAPVGSPALVTELPRIPLPAPSMYDGAISAVLERVAARAWPAAETQEVGGWVVRRTPGVDRR